MNERPSQQEVNKLLEDVEAIEVTSVFGLIPIQANAFNYLLDYVEFGDKGIDRSHAGERLLSLSIEILTQYLWDHGWKPENK